MDASSHHPDTGSGPANRPPLPIDEVLDELVEALRTAGSVVLRAPTGAGKTTRVPPALLDAGLAGDGRVVVLEPRRVAARAAARRVAVELGEQLGDLIGYQIRFEQCSSAQTRLLYVTEGVLLRVLQQDPFLEGVAAVVFDEFHERRLDSDLALAMARRAQREVRPDLMLVVMSATLDPLPIATWFDNCPIVEAGGRSHPVTIDYLPRPDDRSLSTLVGRGLRELWPRVGGDVLVFLPGVGEIRRAESALADFAASVGADLVSLYGDLPSDKQDAVLSASEGRRIVLSTNVAETSVTIEGVDGVVDTGWAKVPRYDPGCGLDRLDRERISRASADQRCGRAGRLGPGRCLRLWTRAQHRALASESTPEVQRLDPAGAVLQLLAWGEPDPGRFDWFEPPDLGSLGRAIDLLGRLGATEGGALVALGRQMAALPLAPRLARVAIEAHRLGVLDRGAVMVAALAERDPFRRRDEAVWVSDSDVVDRLEAIEALLHGRPSRMRPRSRAAIQAVARAAAQIEREVRRLLGAPPAADTPAREGLRRSLLAGYPDRVARRRRAAKSESRGVMVGGRGVRLGSASAVRDAELFLCVDIDAGRRGRRAEAMVWQASAVERDWLPRRLIHKGTSLSFDDREERVVCEAQTHYLDLLLESRRVPPEPPAEVARVLAEAAAERLDSALPLQRPDVAGFLTRLRCLTAWRPDLGLPELDPDALRSMLSVLCQGRRSFDELRAISLEELLGGVLTRAQRDQVERLAPERLAVPSGSRIRLVYEVGRSPVLPVRIQEVFGWAEGPRIAGGRVSVLLHLLAPNMRPQQVTDDLAGFWRRTYPEVRKDLRARYPKHAWPEDPLTASPRRR